MSGIGRAGPTESPVVIAHRGVPGHRLEHTRPSYRLAIEQGADFIEPDVVCTRDGVLVVRHENEIGHTTDVALHPEFADRRTTKLVDGVWMSGWFTEDFLLEELRTLRVRERLPQLRPQNMALAGTERILTFDEVLDIALAANARGRENPVGVYVETKHPAYFAGLGLDLNHRLLAALEKVGAHRRGAALPVVIQSKETGNLRRLRERTSLPLVQLMDLKGAPWDLAELHDPTTYADLCTPARLADVATYADGIGPHKSLVIGRDEHRRLTGDTGLAAAAHDAGLFVHVWTMRDENNFLPADFRTSDDVADVGDAAGEYRTFFDVGVDGVFSDYPATAVAARTQWLAGRRVPVGI